MSFFFVEPEIYKKYKDQVLEMSQSIQVNYVEHLAPEKRKPGFSDKQIAEKLGLDERIVREIRCVGEREFYDVEEWEKATTFKEQQDTLVQRLMSNKHSHWVGNQSNLPGKVKMKLC